MPYNPEAQIFQNQVVINDTTNAGITSGGLVVKGGLSSQDTFITGHVAVNNVKITPNLNDIVNEVQSVLDNSVGEFIDITDFYFDNSITNSFKAQVAVTVSTGISKYAVWELFGVYKPSGWQMTSSFTGDITGVNFTIANDNTNGRGKIQYTNSNSSGTTTIKFRAVTTQPPGTSPTGSTGIINNTSGPYIADTLIYANTTSSIASSDITYASNVLKIGGTSRIVGENANSFTNFSNGGAITSMGDMSVATNLIVGSKIGIAKTSPAYTLDIGGDINFTGTFYQNGSVYSGSSVWGTNGTNVFYTAGNLGLGGMTAPSHALDISGGIKSTSITTGTIIATSANFSTGITAANINFTGDIYKNGNIYVSSQWTTDQSDIYYTSGNVGIGNTAPGKKLDITGDIRVSGDSSLSTVSASSITSGSFVGTSASLTTISASSITSGSFVGTSASLTNMTASSITSGSFIGTTASLTNMSATNSTITSIVSSTVSSGNLYLSSNAYITGDLTVSGTTFTVNTETSLVEDNLIVLNSGPAGLADGGILVKRYLSGTAGSMNYAGIFYKESTDEYTFATTDSDPGTSPVTISSYLPIRASGLTITDTTQATGVGTGGSMNIAGGASIVKDLYVGGNVAASGSVTSSSDIRLKDNIETIDNALEKIENCRGVSYIKKASGEKEIGFIAQELEEIFPEFVITGNDGYKSVAYGNMTAVLVQCIKELKKEIEDLKANKQ
jgi:hypothetical protein